ncbi:MAG: hypothetical protein AAGN35_05030 [Bacteroidota bacterium]
MGNFGDPTTENEVRTAKRINYLSLLFLVAVLAATFYFFRELQNKKAELVEKTQMLADSTDNLQRIRAELEAAQTDLEAREESTLTVLRNVTELVEQADYGTATQLAREYKSREASDRVSLNVYSFGVADRSRQAVDSYLREADHHVLLNREVENPASWLQDSSTVMFFHPNTEEAALRIANDLREVTGQAFRAAMGSPSDVPRVPDQQWINIHHIEPAKLSARKRQGK